MELQALPVAARGLTDLGFEAAPLLHISRTLGHYWSELTLIYETKQSYCCMKAKSSPNQMTQACYQNLLNYHPSP